MAKLSVYIAITHFKRPEALDRLLEQIYVQTYKTYTPIVTVYDDATVAEEGERLARVMRRHYRASWVRFAERHGKERFWQIIQAVFQDMKAERASFYVLLQDDFVLADDFFSRGFATYSEIARRDPKCVSLTPLVDADRAGHPVWTGVHPVPFDAGPYEVLRSQWVDCHFITCGRLMRALGHRILPVPRSRWDQNPLLSSGVGQQMSRRLFRGGYNMYLPLRTLVYHGSETSLMNPNERRLRPLAHLPPEKQ